MWQWDSTVTDWQVAYTVRMCWIKRWFTSWEGPCRTTQDFITLLRMVHNLKLTNCLFLEFLFSMLAMWLIVETVKSKTSNQERHLKFYTKKHSDLFHQLAYNLTALVHQAEHKSIITTKGRNTTLYALETSKYFLVPEYCWIGRGIQKLDILLAPQLIVSLRAEVCTLRRWPWLGPKFHGSMVGRKADMGGTEEGSGFLADLEKWHRWRQVQKATWRQWV